MKKLYILTFLLLATSCSDIFSNFGCMWPTQYEQNMAKSLYNPMFSSRVSLSYDEAKKVFGCVYRYGDRIYTYSRLFDKGYILVRGTQPLAYRAVDY